MRKIKLQLLFSILLLEMGNLVTAQEISPFSNCFGTSDSTNEQVTAGCSSVFYKLIDSKTILRIHVNLIVDYDECMEIQLGELDSYAHLLIFENEQFELTNICTDVIIVNADKPIKTLKATAGKLRIGKSDPTDYYGNQMPKISIFVEQLDFRHANSNEVTNIQDELLWKVLDTGEQG